MATRFGFEPGARRALEALGVWQRLEAGHASVADIAVGGLMTGICPCALPKAQAPTSRSKYCRILSALGI